jgi:hypothetical protein
MDEAGLALRRPRAAAEEAIRLGLVEQVVGTAGIRAVPRHERPHLLARLVSVLRHRHARSIARDGGGRKSVRTFTLSLEGTTRQSAESRALAISRAPLRHHLSHFGGLRRMTAS